MSETLYDLGARLRAAATGRPVRTSAYSPSLPLNAALAVATRREAGTVMIEATDGSTTRRETGHAALDALADLGARLTPVHRTLVIADRATLSDLTALARTAPAHEAAAVIAWWDQRADHPGTGAVHAVIDAARSRWTVGEAPAAERHLATWRTWLNVTTEGVEALLDLARHTSGGRVLPGLLDMAEADTRSWDFHLARIAGGWDWRTTDTRRDAALGLATRSHAAELYDSLRLGDPLVASRAAHSGRVVQGVVTLHDDDHLVIEATRAISRLRTGEEVSGWLGGPENTDDDAPAIVLRSGRVQATTMSTSAVLTITLADTVCRPHRFAAGDLVTLRPRPVDSRQQQRSRSNLARRYKTTGNWLAGRGKPVSRRSDVPLDVVLAAAD